MSFHNKKIFSQRIWSNGLLSPNKNDQQYLNIHQYEDKQD